MSRYMYVRNDHAGSPYQPILNVSLYVLHFLSVIELPEIGQCKHVVGLPRRGIR
jgi:hypothetical protein